MLSTAGCLASATAIGGAMYMNVILCSSISRRKSSRSKRGIVTSLARTLSVMLMITFIP